MNDVGNKEPTEERLKSDPNSGGSGPELSVWRYGFLCFVSLFFVDLCYKLLSKLRAMGQPVFGMVLDTFMVALICAVFMAAFYGSRKK